MLSGALSWLSSVASSPSVNWKTVLLSGALFRAGLLTFIDLREYKFQSGGSPPKEAVEAGIVDVEQFKKSQQYSRATIKGRIIDRLVSFALNFAIWEYGLWPAAFNFWKAELVSHQWAGSKVIGVLTVLTDSAVRTIFGIPLKYYRSIVIEERFGFNKSTLGLWVIDNLKMWVLALVLYPPVYSGIQLTIEYFGDKFIPYLTLFFTLLFIAFAFIIPVLLDPWFNKYLPLEDPELKAAIGDLASSVGFPLGSIYVIDASTRSSHSNAYFVGYPWYKQIVLYDTLLQNNSTEEVIAVLGHELGHWKKNHMTILLTTSVASFLPSFLVLSMLLDNAQYFESLGFHSGDRPILIAVIGCLYATIPISPILGLLENSVARSCEYAADRFSVHLGKGKALRSAIIKFHEKDLSTLESDWLYSLFYDTHPGIIERARAIDAEIKKMN